MFYWSRTGSLTDFGLFLLLSAIWALGGWLIATHAFHVRPRERVGVGLAAGFILFIAFSNLTAQVISIVPAFWLGSALVLGAGAASVWRSGRRPWLHLTDLRAWPTLAALAIIAAVFTLILRGLAIFDDYYHLPMISVMATGDIPPHFSLDPTQHLAYHYGLQVFAAGLVRIAGFFPWSAWDLSRAIVLAFAAVLGWLWVRRLTASRPAAYLGSLLFIFGGGARWLLLLLPVQTLARLGAGLKLEASGMVSGGNLLTDLTRPWAIGGGGPIPFPFAFANGIFPALNISLGATGALPAMTLFLLLLILTRRRLSVPGVALSALLLANLGLSAEHTYVLAVVGVPLAMIGYVLTRRGRPVDGVRLRQWALILVMSFVVALIQGGFISVALQERLARLRGTTYPVVTTDYQGFSFRWPPAIPSGHLGPLTISDPKQFTVLMAELGPAALLAPLVIALVIVWRRKSSWLPQGLAIGSVLVFLFPVFFRYGLDFDITRMSTAALWLWMVLTFPVLWLGLQHARPALTFLAGTGYAVAVLGGIVLFGIELVAMATPTTTNFVRYGEVKFSRLYWNRMDPHAQILDSLPERAVTLFGRASLASKDVYTRLPEWRALIADPDPATVARAGYSYIYEDRAWNDLLTPEQREALKQPCVRLIESLDTPDGDFRRLLDVRACG